MIRFLITTALLVIATMDGWAQLSVYICDETEQVGWSTGLDNLNGSRDSKAYLDCKNKGGKFPVLRASHNGPGCYAIVTGRTEKGVFAYGIAAGYPNTEQAIDAARTEATLRGALTKSLSNIASGCDWSPPPKQVVKKVPVWSEWTSEICSYLEYRTKVQELYDWNYQVHVYVEVRSKFRIPVAYVFQLVDEDGKVQFGDLRQNNPGEKIEFVHKMSKNNIKRVRITELRNANTNKPVNCDDADGGKKPLRAGEYGNLQEALQEYNKLLGQMPEGITKTRNYEYTTKILNSKETEEFKLQTVNAAVAEFRGILDHLPAKAATSQNQQDLSGDINELSRKEISLINDIRAVEPNASLKAWDGNPGDAPAFTLQKKKENVAYLENYLGKVNAKATEEKAVKEREKSAFNSLMQKGDEAMKNKYYAQAMNTYQAAMNGTSDVNDKAAAQQKYNMAMEAKKSADREVRVADAVDRDKKEDALYTTAAVSAAGFMALLKDGYSSRGFAAKFLLGLGYDHSPILSNGNGKSYIEERNLVTINTGFTIGILNNRPISFYLKPQLNMAMSAFASGISGGYASYGGTGVLQLAWKKHSKFNVFAEGGWFKNSGTFKYDADARNNTATDDVREGNMSFTRLVYGGGLMLRWIGKSNGKETYLRPGVFYDKPSFFTDAVKPVLTMNFQVYIYSAILLDMSYTPKTYIAGDLLHPSTLERKNVDAYSIKIIRQGRLY
ncbi:MAG: hypothetical protein J7623_22690 [Chitinophaga sp.]|uniref:hypothetical protein n=1 Tax=Chitinophaga sp. TaxID=1869181 RepID=UPI001B007D12|nr:hypothetical protein [Chitinophaga sp.]MBO9731466.1 hypothetical protein [Chitinophaga sp.]